MSVYLARLKGTHELVGVFYAHSNEQLCDLVDECCDIDVVEILRLGPGGLYWGGPIDYRLPWTGPAEDTPDMPAGASWSEWWLDQAHSKEAKWKPLQFGNSEAA